MNKAPHYNRWLYAFISFHVLIWTLLPSFIRNNLPMDALEGATWGQHFALGYDKNPFLNGWLTALAVKIGGTSGWTIYLFSQISVALCFFAIWRLGNKFLPAVYVLVAVFLLELTTIYNIGAIDFDDNILELGLWAFMILCFYNALVKQKIIDWIGVGIFAGLSMMAKYYAVMLFLPMLVLLLINEQSRASFKKPGLYICLIIFLVIIAPHFIWLFSHHFITIIYAFARTNSTHSWINHLIYPLNYFSPHIPGLLFALLGFCILLIGKKTAPFLAEKVQLNQFDWQFLLLIGLGPFIGTIVLSFITGIYLHSGWARPVFSLWGLILVAAVNPKITLAGFYRFIISVFLLMLIASSLYIFWHTRASDKSSANYPGKAISTNVTYEWHNLYHKPLLYVAGPRWLAGNIAFYSNDNPSVYMEWNPITSFWIHEKSLRKQGAVFVWGNDLQGKIPANIAARFSALTHLHTEYFYAAHDTQHTGHPIKIWVAFLPPS